MGVEIAKLEMLRAPVFGSNRIQMGNISFKVFSIISSGIYN